MTTPGYGGPDRTDLSGESGTGGAPDPTFEPGGYADSLFGVKLPQTTGAGGSAGAQGPADSTTQPGQLEEGLSGGARLRSPTRALPVRTAGRTMRAARTR